MGKRRCQAKTKAGKPCQAVPRHDTGCCNAHSPREVQESAGFGGSQPGAGRPRVPRVTEVMRDWLEAHADEVLRPYIDAIENARVIVNSQGVAYVTDIADLGARIQAAEKLQDRVLGRPRQAVEHSGSPESAVPVALRLDASTREMLSDVLRGRPASRGD